MKNYKYNYFTNICIDCNFKCNRSAKRCRKCADKQHSINISKENHPNWKGRFSTCQNCRKKLSRRDAKLCIKCSNIGKKNGNYKDGRSLKKNYCFDCNKEIESHHIRCRICENKTKLRKIKMSKRMAGKENPNFNYWSSFEPYPLGWTKIFKKQIRYRDSYKCQLCECPEIECNRKLDVHHIDYDKQNINTNNLISLCHRCHMKTNGNRDYWKKYYKEKSMSKMEV